jgi:tyrosyl-tRNA synthetase
MWRYMLLLSDASEAEIETRKHSVAAGRAHPMDLKKDLAEEIVRGFHSAAAARSAREEFERVIQRKETPREAELFTYRAPVNRAIRVDKMLAELGLVSSVSEAARLIKSGGVSFDGARAELTASFDLSNGPIELNARVGKHRFARIRIER